MHVGNRIFPYPVLRSNNAFSDYSENNTFCFSFETDDNGCPIFDGEEIVLKDAHYELICPYLENLIDNGKAKVLATVECSYTMIRKTYEINRFREDIRLKKSDFRGEVTIDCVVYATQDIFPFKPTGLIEDYSDLSFDNIRINKYSVLATDDGISFKIIVEEGKDDLIASIFRIVKLEDDASKLAKYSSESSQVTISLPSQYYNSYESIKMHSDYNNLVFAIFAIPVLANCLQEIKKANFESLEDACESYSWLKSVALSYKKATGFDLSMDNFENEEPFTLAQTVLNYATCEGIRDFSLILSGGSEGYDEGGIEDE